MFQHTCAYEEHIVRSLVEWAHFIHRYPGEVNTFSEQEGARFRPQLHQRMLFGEVKRRVRQLEGTVVAVLPVKVGDALRKEQEQRMTFLCNGQRAFEQMLYAQSQ